MENITIGQIVAAIIILSTIAGFICGIYKFLDKVIFKRFEKIEAEIAEIKENDKKQKEEIEDSKEERLILLNGLLACLKGLHNDLNCNGPVTKGIEDIEAYLMSKAHK